MCSQGLCRRFSPRPPVGVPDMNFVTGNGYEKPLEKCKICQLVRFIVKMCNSLLYLLRTLKSPAVWNLRLS